MKIGFPVDSNSINALIKERMSSATWLLVVETDDMSFEAVPAPEMSSGSGSGIKALSLLLEREGGVQECGKAQKSGKAKESGKVQTSGTRCHFCF